MDATLALNRLQQDSTGLVGHDTVQRIQIIVRHIPETARQRLIAFPVFRLPCRCQSGQCASVKGVFGCNDLHAVGAEGLAEFAGQLYGAFVRFRPAVGQKDPVHAGQLSQPRGQGSLLCRIIQVGTVDQAAGLPGNSRRQNRMGVTQYVDGNTRQKIEVFLAFHIVHIRAFTMGQNDGVPGEDRQVVRLILGHNLLFVHLNPSRFP